MGPSGVRTKIVEKWMKIKKLSKARRGLSYGPNGGYGPHEWTNELKKEFAMLECG